MAEVKTKEPLMHNKQKEVGHTYYTKVSENNWQEVDELLDESVRLCSPMAVLEGKKAVIEATRNFRNMVKSLRVRSSFGSETQAVVLYECDVPGISDAFPGASLLDIDEKGKIIAIQLYYDSHPFLAQKEQIYS